MNAFTLRVALAVFLAAMANAAAAQAPSSVATCAGCHGANGEGNAASNFPRLAGQSAYYLARQLKAYADGSRINSVMGPIAKSLSPEQIEAAANYFAQLNTPPAKATQAPSSPRARLLATTGDDKIGIQACANCHGPGGIGEPPAYPYLAAQHSGYLQVALTAWKNGTRKTDPSMQMNMIAKRLSESDIAALSAYYAAQAPAVPQSFRTKPPAGAGERPNAGGNSSQPDTASPDKAGVEQSTPTSGGGVGPGGGGGTNIKPPYSQRPGQLP